MPWDGPNAKDKCSLAFEIIDLTTLNLGLFSVIRLRSKCDAAYCGLKIFLSGYETAISPQKYISKSHWPHKSILHMMSQCSIIIWVTTLVTNACCLKGHLYKEHHKCLWSWKSSLHSQPLLTFLHSLQWPLDYGGTQHLGSQHLRTQHFWNSQHFRYQWTKMGGNEQI